MKLSEVGDKIFEAVELTASYAGTGYLVTWAFININPIVGAVFGAAYGVAGAALDPIFHAKDSNLPSNMLGTALKITLSAIATMLVLGTTLSLKTTLAVSIGLLVANPIVTGIVLFTGAALSMLAVVILNLAVDALKIQTVK
jgi:hypothetical protein